MKKCLLNTPGEPEEGMEKNLRGSKSRRREYRQSSHKRELVIQEGEVREDRIEKRGGNTTFLPPQNELIDAENREKKES